MSSLLRYIAYLVVALITALSHTAAYASDGIVGPGNCDEPGFVSVLNTVQTSGGGAITFNCGPALTISFTSYRQISSTVVIDGADAVTFDGNNVAALFQIFSTANLALKRLTLKRGVFSSAHALENFGTLTIDRCTISQNSGASAIVSTGTLSIHSSTFSGNSINSGAARAGAALRIEDGDVRIDNSVFNGNSTGTIGTGGAIVQSGGTLTVVATSFSNNSAADGGAMYLAAGTTTTIARSTFSGNSAGYGAAIETFSPSLTVRDSTFSGNNAVNGDGGAIWILGGVISVDRSQFVDNVSATTGGAISCYGDYMIITNSAFGNNRSGTVGGAIYNACGLGLTNATLHGNATTGINGGGAVYHDGPKSALVSFATINGNSAAFGGGLYHDPVTGGELIAGQSILSANIGGNCDGVVGTNGYNVVNDTGCGGFDAASDLQNANLPLASFADNGGPTFTQLPMSGNVAIDRIPAAQCFTPSDQRSGIRPTNGNCDVGAVELNAVLDFIFADGLE